MQMVHIIHSCGIFLKACSKVYLEIVESRYFYFLVHELFTYVSLRQLVFANPSE